MAAGWVSCGLAAGVGRRALRCLGNCPTPVSCPAVLTSCPTGSAIDHHASAAAPPPGAALPACRPAAQTAAQETALRETATPELAPRETAGCPVARFVTLARSSAPGWGGRGRGGRRGGGALGEHDGDHRRGQAAARRDPARHLGDAALATVAVGQPGPLGVVHRLSLRRASWKILGKARAARPVSRWQPGTGGGLVSTIPLRRRRPPRPAAHRVAKRSGGVSPPGGWSPQGRLHAVPIRSAGWLPACVELGDRRRTPRQFPRADSGPVPAAPAGS
jgi:hypothetical protein